MKLLRRGAAGMLVATAMAGLLIAQEAEPAGATVFTVTDPGDAGANTLRAAIDMATADVAGGPHTPSTWRSRA